MSTTSKDELSQNDLIRYEVDKQRLFKTTITIAAVYGTIAFVMLIAAFADTNGASGLSTEFLPFTVTFIGGMIVVLILMVIQVVTFKPVASKNKILNDNICPDYWILKASDSSDADYNSAGATAKGLMSYKCVPDPNVYNLGIKADKTNAVAATTDINSFGQQSVVINAADPTQNVYAVGIPAHANTDSRATDKLRDTATAMYSGSQAQKGANAALLRCDVVYPQYLANEDLKQFPLNPTQLRCEYAKKCGIPWSGVCPNVSQL